ncbi:hypothetical protein [Cronobacter dublinensis]|uniref:hypothetical protein n=1 Tax=Cronobacter dublinensis TaxID=413497 RepID=UPI0024AF7722|nr:hypothetical protein [Cronobacter dublinensis]MDI7501998.1 hypothetical protein [Cronobacter dublinensis]
MKTTREQINNFKSKQMKMQGIEKMLLRDYFAAKAMCALLSNNSEDAEVRVLNGHKYVAARAYEMADAMLKAREE